MVKDVKKAIKVAKVELEVDIDEHEIVVNGIEEQGHETFVIKRTGGRDFCKTARKPYDIVVCMALIALEHHARADISSDGDQEDWQDAIDMCQKHLGYGNDFLIG